MMKKISVQIILIFLIVLYSIEITAENLKPLQQAKYVIIYVWDGLRPDAVTPENTPNLYQIMQQGTQFVDNHSSYPTFTMMNAASFATGDRAGKTGFFGNTLWHPGITGTDAAGNPVDFQQPIFTEDYKILQALNKDDLFFVNTLFNAAHEKQLMTAAVGKSGPVFMQDYLSYGLTLDEKHIHPVQFAKQTQQTGYSLPKLSPLDYNAGELVLAPNNGDPTAADKIKLLMDGATSDPTDQHGSPFNRANEYMVNIYLNEIVAKKMPSLSVIWLRNPDSTEHNYGPGTFNYFDALHHNDKMLGELISHLKAHNLLSKTDIFVVSDHGHSSVSGPVDQFPLREVKDQQVGDINPQGFSVSGEVRTAHLLTKAGFNAYDGNNCAYNPVLSGIKEDNQPLYPVQIDVTGKICGKIDAKYITSSYKVPHDNLPKNAIIVASNGGTDYLYVTSHDKELIKKIVGFLASHQQYDAIFIDNRYGDLEGTIPLGTIGIENPQGRSPDVVVGFSYDTKVKINGLAGIEFSDYFNLRGMHGSFSPIDVHNFMMAVGPDFREHFKDELPTGNVDLAPTVAAILNLNLNNTDGRVLKEALQFFKSLPLFYQVEKVKIKSRNLPNLTIFNALNQKVAETNFSTELNAKVLSEGKNKYYYFDSAKGMRIVS